MKKLLTFAFLFMFAALLNAQILVDNFDYPVGDALTAHGWNAHSGAGTRPISVVTGNLTYTGYTNSGVGNMVAFNGGSSGEDINVLFTTQTSGTVYASILVNPYTLVLQLLALIIELKFLLWMTELVKQNLV